MSDDTTATAADGQRPADSIPVEATPAPKPIETAETLNKAAAAAAETPAADPAPEAETTTETPKVKRLDDWAEKRISEEAFHRREEARRRKEAEDRATQLAAEVEALRKGQQPPVTPPAQQAPAQLAINPADFESAVQQRAAALAVQQAAEARFNEDCNRVAAEGKAAYKEEFEAALSNLQAAGVTTAENLQAIIGTGDGARLIYELGSDPAEAARIFNLSPTLRAIELGKRAAVKPAKAAAAVSNAPAPIKPLDGSARVSSEPRDDDDDATYFAKRREQLKARRGW